MKSRKSLPAVFQVSKVYGHGNRAQSRNLIGKATVIHYQLLNATILIAVITTKLGYNTNTKLNTSNYNNTQHQLTQTQFKTHSTLLLTLYPINQAIILIPKFQKYPLDYLKISNRQLPNILGSREIKAEGHDYDMM